MTNEEILSRIHILYEMAKTEYEEKLRRARNLFITESVDSEVFDDVDTILIEAESEFNSKKESILKRIIKAIINICKKIIDKIKSLIRDKRPVDAEAVRRISGEKRNINTVIDYIKNNKKKTAAVVAAIASITATTAYLKNRSKKQKRDDMEDLENDEEFQRILKNTKDLVNLMVLQVEDPDGGHYEEFEKLLNHVVAVNDSI